MSRKFAVLIGTVWLLALVAIDAAVLLRPESLRRQVDMALDRIFESKVTYEEFQGGWPRDLVLRRVEIMHPQDPTSLLMSVDEIHIGINWTGAVFGASPVEEIKVVRPHLELAWNANGVLEIPSPLRESEGSGEDDGSPRVKIEGLSLHLLNTPFLVKRDVNIALEDFAVSLIPEGSDDWLYQFSAKVNDEALGNLEAHGHFRADAFDLELTRNDFVVTAGLKEILQPEVAELLDRFHIGGGIEMVGELVSLEESLEQSEGAGARFEARIELDGVDVEIRGWPGPDGRSKPWPQKVSGLSGVITYAEGRFEVHHRVIGFLEDARLWFEGYADFTRGKPDIRIDGSLVGLDLTDRFVERLADLPDPGPEICEQLNQWAVRGPADVGFVLEQKPGLTDDDRLIPRITVELKGCELTYRGRVDEVTGKREGHGFPYRVRNLFGAVELDDRGLRFSSLRGTDGSLTLQARGTVDYSRAGNETYQAHVWVSGLEPDEDLFAAFDDETARILRDLEMQGSVDVQVIAERKRTDPIAVAPEIVIELNGLRLRPKVFPFLLEDARGQVVIGKDGLIKFESLTVRHGRSRLQAWGHVGVGERSGELMGSIGLRELALDDELRAALEVLVPEVDAVIEELAATGRIDRANVTLRGTPERPDPSIEATIHLEDAAIAPKDPAVRIHEVSAVLDVWHRPGRQEIAIRDGAGGTIAGERFVASGRFRPGRDWILELKSEDFVLDDEMLTALEGVLPALADREGRPEIDGHAKADVTITDGPRGTNVVATIETKGITVRPPGWKVARLEDVDCKLRIDRNGFNVENLVARIPRPAGLPDLPQPTIRGQIERPFQTDPAILVRLARAGISVRRNGGLRIGMGDVRLSNVPLEKWVLDVLGMSKTQRDAFEVPPISGIMNLSFTTAIVGENTVTLNGGSAQLLGIHLGERGELYLEEGTLSRLDFGLDRFGAVSFGSKDTLLEATNFRLLGIPIPWLQAQVEGDEQGVSLKGIVGCLFGYDYDAFDLKKANRADLERRVVARGYLEYSEARRKSDAQLRELIETREGFDLEHATLRALRDHATEKGYVTPARANNLTSKQLRALILERSAARELGIIDGEASNLTVSWNGEFKLAALLRDVYVGPALKVLGSRSDGPGGRLKARIKLGGNLDELGSWKGEGVIQADGLNIVRLPLFLNILKTLDVTSLVSPRTQTKLRCEFEIADTIVKLTSGRLTSPRLLLELEPPGTITFGGIIKARLGADHTGGLIPGLSDLIGLIPGLLLTGVVVEGPLEDPKVEPRSFDLGSNTPGTAGGRKPRLKPPRKDG